MVNLTRVSFYKTWQNLRFLKSLSNEGRTFSSLAQTGKDEEKPKSDNAGNQTMQESSDKNIERYRFIYPEFLPDPNSLHRNSLTEKLERLDMLARRSVINIPEFYVGSVLRVTYSEPHASGKVNQFVGICILRECTGLRSSFLLRNIVDKEPVEIRFELYDPAIKKIECLRLEKRLDKELLYLRDAPPEYSTFPFNMEAEVLPTGAPVPVNKIKVPITKQKWSQKWELFNLKGVTELVVTEKRRKKAEASAKPWEKYDLMKTYRETIPEEEQKEIFTELYTELSQLEVKKRIDKRKRQFVRPKKM
ncbi:mitochondrial ribosomal protein L19 [Nomia melanderi]|uniref:mitochondrial ribosomal protein L19 n=1 Tax=Nomia melanderi TaxID=2448451 RepID=UPI0013042462|nr:39S ribosomal protein L19, mitochondrial [Nomia melanderi]